MEYLGKTENDKDLVNKEYVDSNVGSNLTLKQIYPVGTVLEFGEDIDPNNLSEWSGIDWTWERYAEGLVTVGKKDGDSLFGGVGEKVGSRDAVVVTHDHTTPAHGHTIEGGNCTATSAGTHAHSMKSAGDHYHTVYAKKYERASGKEATTTPQNSSSNNNRTSGTNSAGAHIHTVNNAGAHTHPVPAHSHTVTGGRGTSGSTGSPGTNKNIQPSIVVSKWIRVT